MAMKYFPFDSEFLRVNEMGFPEGDRDADSADWALYMSSFIGNGIFPNPADNLKVVPSSGMTISVLPGRVFINGRLGWTDEPVSLTLEPSSVEYDRVDRVVARLDLNAEKREIELYAVKGTPASSSSPPVVTRNGKVYELVLADVLVKKNISEIQLHQITDTRLDAELCGVVAQLAKEVDFSVFYNQFGQFEEKYNDWFDGKFTQWFNKVAGLLEGSAVTNLTLEIMKRPQIHVSETEPDNWENGDWWYQVMSRQPAEGGADSLIELITTEYDAAKTYHLKDAASGVTESIENFGDNVLLITET